jgi:crossover junction endodeoxyribonuclease RuvC
MASSKARSAGAAKAHDAPAIDPLGGQINCEAIKLRFQSQYLMRPFCLAPIRAIDRFARLPKCGCARMSVLGIDTGTKGALALLASHGGLIDIADMPVLADGPKGRPSVNAPVLAALIQRWSADRAFVEFVGARPGEGAVGAFAFGRSRGVVERVLGVCGVPAKHISAASWKRAVGLTLAPKHAARSEAIRRWPHRADLFSRAKEDGRADAALIAVAGLMREAA